MGFQNTRSFCPVEIMQLHRDGLSIVPIEGGSRRPLAKWSEFQTQQPSDDQVEAWFGKKPDTNVAVVTGAVSGVIVLDIDVRDDGRNGFEGLAKKGWRLPDTPYVKTGNGRHYYFRHPGFDVGNRTALIPGVDLRGDGGLALAPPSLHANGNRYRWAVPFDRQKLADAPLWLLEIIAKQRSTTTAASTHQVEEADESTDYGLAALFDEAETLAATTAGNRNTQLNIASVRAGELCAAGEVTRDDAEAVLVEAAQDAGLSFAEATATFNSGFQYGLKHPRQRGVVNLPGKASISCLPLNALVPVREAVVTKSVMKGLREAFASPRSAHKPSDQVFVGLQQIAMTIDGMISGKIGDKYYVSYMPPGTGKTTTLVHCVRAIRKLKQLEDIGIIIFLSRCEEIDRLVADMELGPEDFAVFTSDATMNDKGRAYERGEAKVLFTTQQQLQARSKGTKNFADMDVFWFRGKPRQVRVWDEAILPAEPITLERYALDSLRRGLTLDGSKQLADAIDAFALEVKAAAAGAILEVPNVKSQYDSAAKIRAAFPIGQKDTAETFQRLSGRRVRVRPDEVSGNALLDYDDILPADLAPMLILDASAEQRKTYELWQRHRKGIEFLPSFGKDYAGLTIHHWNRGAGKTSLWRDKHKTVATGIAKTIDKSIPKGEEVLVIYPKASADLDLQADVLKFVQSNRKRIKFCNWGKHTATNEFKDIKHVILAGQMLYSGPTYEAIARAAGGLSTDVVLDDADYRAVRLGEIAHNVFQAANRGYVRHSDGDGCPNECHLYVVFSSNDKNGVPSNLLERIFPNASLVDWHPIYKLVGRYQKVFEALMAHGRAGRHNLPRAELMNELGVTDANDFRRLLRNKNLTGALGEQGIEIEVDTKNVRLFQAADTSTLPKQFSPYLPEKKVD